MEALKNINPSYTAIAKLIGDKYYCLSNMAEDRQACMADTAEGGHTRLLKEERIILNFWLIIQMDLNISAFMGN